MNNSVQNKKKKKVSTKLNQLLGKALKHRFEKASRNGLLSTVYSEYAINFSSSKTHTFDIILF